MLPMFAGFSMKGLARTAGLFFFTAGLAGCATYQSKVAPSRGLLMEGKAAEASDLLKPLADTVDGDQLVYLLDYATALQAAGRFQDSNREFLRAEELAEAQDYHSVSRVAGSLLLNEETKQYKGDTFEKIFINAQLSMNFLAMGNLESALVEARRMNEKYQKLRSEDKKNFELNPFAKYLSALTWEADRAYDDAAIAYREAYEISPAIQGIREDLIRVSKLSKRDNEYKKWKKEFPEVRENPDWYDKSKGELVILVQQGWGPRKDFSRGDHTWPVLVPVRTQTRSVRLSLPGEPRPLESRVVYDVERAAILTLEDDRASLIARRLTGVVAKEVAAREIQRKNELLGVIAWFAMHASDRADLRQWSTLPETIQVIRVDLKPGAYDFSLSGVDAVGAATADFREWKDVRIQPRKKTFITWRTLR